ncbi:MAG: class I SAM-dependent RNA methyltransferase [Acidimicrobiia bacterium]|nr:class I SAM-dependent RNA methyltransferase [Acidimicrobiia bacterium]
MTIEVTTAAMAHGGKAVARHEGQVLFVTGAYPHEVVQAEVTEAKKRHSFARALAIFEPSPHRRAAPCPHFGPCGGCQWQSAEPGAQAEWKREIVADQLRFVGKLGNVEVRPTISPGPEFGYRNRMDFALVGGRPALHREESQELVELSVCLLLVAPLFQLFVDLPIRPLADRVTLRAGVATGETAVLFDDEHGVIHEEVAGHTFRVTDRAFFQANTAGAEELVRLVTEVLAPGPNDRLLDGYAGGGLFAATVGAGCREVVAVESDPVAVADLKANADLVPVRAKFESSRPRLPRSWDLVVVDPPRAGLGREGVETVVAGHPRTVALVACDPASFARDAALFTNAGYRLEYAQPVDMFPQTFHIEIVGAFSR